MNREEEPLRREEIDAFFPSPESIDKELFRLSQVVNSINRMGFYLFLCILVEEEVYGPVEDLSKHYRRITKRAIDA